VGKRKVNPINFDTNSVAYTRLNTKKIQLIRDYVIYGVMNKGLFERDLPEELLPLTREDEEEKEKAERAEGTSVPWEELN
jgi:hypothetical protein